MMNNDYLATVRKIVQILPIIEKKNEFALKGGTAWNLFYDALPRLSLDIDLVYLPINERRESLHQINLMLKDIGNEVTRVMNHDFIFIEGKSKLLIKTRGLNIKIEPNIVIRGSLYGSVNKEMDINAQEVLELHTSMNCLTPEEIIGGKVIASIDRQHPRDLFDMSRIMNLYDLEDAKIMNAIYFYILQSNRPVYELLNPNEKDIEEIYNNQFVGLTKSVISLDELLLTRKRIIAFMQNEFLKKFRSGILDSFVRVQIVEPLRLIVMRGASSVFRCT